MYVLVTTNICYCTLYRSGILNYTGCMDKRMKQYKKENSKAVYKGFKGGINYDCMYAHDLMENEITSEEMTEVFDFTKWCNKVLKKLYRLAGGRYKKCII